MIEWTPLQVTAIAAHRKGFAVARERPFGIEPPGQTSLDAQDGEGGGASTLTSA
jgi:hypothetical protein